MLIAVSGFDTSSNDSFPVKQVAAKVALAAGIGLLVGLEREWAQKEIGVRTFAITGMLGMLASLVGQPLIVACIVAVLVMTSFLNVHSLLKDRSLELTTSVCLIVTFLLGTLVGLGHPFTAATSAIAMMSLLAWKFELERFAGALKPEEIRGAVLLGLLSVVIYPLLPDQYIDSWQLINPRQSWVIVVVIAGIGFVNYVLLRLYSTKGLYYSAVLGGLVNSTAAVSELATIFAGQAMEWTAVAVLLLTNIAMFLRNLVILAVFAQGAIHTAIIPLAVMSLAAFGIAWVSRRRDDGGAVVKLSSPISLRRILKFAALFLALQVAGAVAQRKFGSLGFLVVSLLGGLVSSASTTATAASLATSKMITYQTAGIGVVLTSISSALVNLPIVYQQAKSKSLSTRLTMATLVVVALGIGALLAIELAHF